MKNKKQKAERKNTILFLVIDIVAVLAGLYGVFVSLTGGMGYINSPDKRFVDAEVVNVRHTYEKDDDGSITGEKWKATLRYTVGGETYTTKRTYSVETYRGETVSIEVYKTPSGKYKESKPNTLAVILSVSILIIGVTGLIEENKERQKKKEQQAKAKIKKDIKKSEKIEGGSQDGTV